MFSGIVETMGRVVEIRDEQSNKHFTLEAGFTGELRIDQSVSHNGVCLTVVELTEKTYTVTAMHETLVKSNLGRLRVGDHVNLERSMRPDALLDGHIVQGHVDRTAVCTSVEEAGGSWYYTFEYDPEGEGEGMLTVEKGSVAVNGVSLTVVDSRRGAFRVAIIPYTHEHTNFRYIVPGSVVNLEFDIIGKYIARLVAAHRNG
jgi:riboflavin synthase